MTYEELVEKARELYGAADASAIKEHVAYQFNIWGEAEGAFYVEISDGRIRIEPYEYYDRDVLFITSADTLIKIATCEMDAMWAYTSGKLKVEGNLQKALILRELCNSIKEQKKAGKKPKAAEPAAAEEAVGQKDEAGAHVELKAVTKEAAVAAPEKAVAPTPVAAEETTTQEMAAAEETVAAGAQKEEKNVNLRMPNFDKKRRKNKKKRR